MMLKMDKFIGLTEAQANTLAQENGYTTRVMSRNGERFCGTADMQMRRVNLTIENDLVTAAKVG